MSTDIQPAPDVVLNNETTNVEQSEASTTNGLLHSNGTTGVSETSIEEQVESTKATYDDNGQSAFNKNELEPESLRKVFIGGLSYKTEDQPFREYFSKYGDIVVS
jgi:hypothetical protein